jgi:tetratricopeptide (TPR) repeat protein
MQIKIKHNAIELPDSRTVTFDTPLTVEKFQDEINVLDKASSGDLEAYRPDEQWLSELGQKLYQRVQIPHNGSSEPLVLDIEPELMDLPWEFLHDGTKFLVLNPGIIRCFNNNHKAGKQCAQVEKDQLKVTVLLASPLLNADPDEYPPVNLETGLYDPLRGQPSVLNFRQEVKGFTDLEGKPYPLFFDLFRRTRKRTFRDALTQGCHIFHFSGHGDRGSLFLENDIATSDPVDTHHVSEIGVHPDMRLVFLNACLTGARATDSISMAEAFGYEGVPWSIAMKYPITTRAANMLSQTFYGHLSQGSTIAESLRLARHELKDRAYHAWAFGIPLLFTSEVNDVSSPLFTTDGHDARIEVRTRGGKLLEPREEQFAGRRRELVKIAKVLCHDSTQPGLVLHGPGGMGKTALALEAAHRFGEDFDEVIFAAARKELPSPELAGELKGAGTRRQAATVPELFYQVVREFKRLNRPVELPPDHDFNDLSDALVNRFNEPGQRLIIFDNLEDLYTESDKEEILDSQLVELLNQLPHTGCKVILTSRTDFTNLPKTYERISVTPLEGREIAEFFQELFFEQPKQAPHEALSAIMRKTGGHPFTLRLAIAWLEEGWPLIDVLERLTDTTQESWKYLVENALQRMGQNESLIYQALSLFTSGTKDVLQQVVGINESDFLRALYRLVRFSLVIKQPHPLLNNDYYSLVPLVKEDAEKKRRSEPEQEREMKERFSQWELDSVKGFENSLQRGESKKYLILWDQEIDNFISGGDYLKALGCWDDAVIIYKDCIIMAEALDDGYAEARISNNLGLVLADKGDWDGAIQYYEKSLKTFERLGDLHGMAQTYNNLGLVLADKGDWDGAIQYYEKSLTTKERLGDLHGMAQTYNNLGNVFYRKGDWDGAIQYYEKDLEISERLGDLHGVAITQYNIALIHSSRKDYKTAVSLALQALEVFKKLGSPNAAMVEEALQEWQKKTEKKGGILKWLKSKLHASIVISLLLLIGM